MHYTRWRRHGDPLVRSFVPGEGTLSTGGYRKVFLPDHPDAHGHGYVYEHRLVWWEAHGPIPEGYIVHHVDGDELNNALENLMCVTPAEHRAIHGAEQQSRRTHCKRGHEFTEENIYLNLRGNRQCLICKRAADRRRRVAKHFG